LTQVFPNLEMPCGTRLQLQSAMIYDYEKTGVTVLSFRYALL